MSGDDAARALLRSHMVVSGLPELALKRAVADAAPQGPGACEMAQGGVCVDALLKVLPSAVHRRRMDETDRTEAGLHLGGDGQGPREYIDTLAPSSGLRGLHQPP